MPYTIRKVNRRRCYRVTNRTNKRVFARCTAKRKALRQVNLLRAIRYNKHFVQKNRRPSTNQVVPI